jgi:hypothetical protein
VAAMSRLEREIGADVPALVHTDMRICNQDLDPIADSMLKYLHRKPNLPLNRLCVENPVYGPTIMINKPLRRLIKVFPEGAVAEDWWLALLATIFGRILFLDEVTVLYRRHSRNTSTTLKHSVSGYLSRSLSRYRWQLTCTFDQCEALVQNYGEQLNAKDKKLLAAASIIRHSNWFMRRYLILRHRLFKTGFLKTAGLLAAV